MTVYIVWVGADFSYFKKHFFSTCLAAVFGLFFCWGWAKLQKELELLRRFASAIMEAERALKSADLTRAAAGSWRKQEERALAALKRLKYTGAECFAGLRGGWVEEVGDGPATVLWAIWPEPDALRGWAFMTSPDLAAFAEDPGSLMPGGHGAIEGGTVFLGWAPETGTWSFVSRYVTASGLLGKMVVWGLTRRGYRPLTLRKTENLLEVLRDPRAARELLRGMRVVPLEAIKTIRALNG